jgi:ABC-type glycerol-3-phosphate transport system substrate-binding protein
MKKYLLGLMLFAVLLFAAACAEDEPSDPSVVPTDPTVVPTDPTVVPTDPTVVPTDPTMPAWDPLDTNATGEISIMLWSGDGTFTEDVGKLNLEPADLAGQNNATIYAVAKAFNEIYPNVKVNVYAKQAGPNDGGVSWDQERENFKNTYGHYPSIWASTDLPGDTTRGLVADLSKYSADPLYQSFNESIMSMMNYYGVQAGLPQYLLPWGVYVNKELAENNNIDVPNPNWTIQEYTDFVSQSDNTNFWGAMDTPFSFIFTGTTTMAAQLNSYTGTGDRININSNEVRTLLPYLSQWADNAIWAQLALNTTEEGDVVPYSVMNDNWWWGYKFFMENKILTLDGDPWMMGDAAHPSPDHWGVVKSNDWDIYPRPSTPYQGNTVGVVLDPLAVYNYAMEDGNPEYTAAEAMKEKIAYTFASFWIGDDRAWQARADQMFLDGENLKSAMNDSFPLVTGDAFERQMNIWYSIDIHARYANATLMPGFQEVLRIFEAGEIHDVSDKAYLWNYDNDGTMSPILYEWLNVWNPAVITGDPDASAPLRTDTNWVDTVLAKLPQWNTDINARYVQADAALRQGLIQFYGKEASDFS